MLQLKLMLSIFIWNMSRIQKQCDNCAYVMVTLILFVSLSTSPRPLVPLVSDVKIKILLKMVATLVNMNHRPDFVENRTKIYKWFAK